MRLSIIVPVYNVEQFLPQCLDSLIMQSVDQSQIEIIVVNDSSPDQSLEIAKAYQLKHPQIKIVNRINGGIAAARNTGIEAATGEYVVMLDSDDYYSADFFEGVFRLMVDEQPDVILMDYNYFYSKDNKHEKVKRLFKSKDVNNKKGKDVLETILRKEPMFTWYPWAYIIKRSLIIEHDLFFVPNRNYEDIMWTPLIFLYAEKMWYMDKVVLEYRLQREGQITGTLNFKNVADPIFAPDYILQRIRGLDITSHLQNKIMRNISSKYFIAYIYAGRLNRNERNQLIRLLKEHRHLLNYTNTLLSRIIRRLANVLGIKRTVELLKLVNSIYQLFKKRK